jgi:hypothetical protein
MERHSSGSGESQCQTSFHCPTHRSISSSIKVLTIIGIIILGIIVDLDGGPNHDRIGFRYWKNPGPFMDYHGITGPKGYFLGTCSVTTEAVFSFTGIEAVAVRGFITVPSALLDLSSDDSCRSK